jgi:hypothetical protein
MDKLLQIGFLVIALGLLHIGVSEASCYSDFDCGIGNKCVKQQFQSDGVCMKTVNEYGTQKYDMPKTNSVGPKMDSGSCSFDTDCPIGFRCDRKYKECIKR